MCVCLSLFVFYCVAKHLSCELQCYIIFRSDVTPSLAVVICSLRLVWPGPQVLSPVLFWPP